MRYYSLYSVKIKHYNHILKETVSLYRKVTDFFLQVCLKESGCSFYKNSTSEIIVYGAVMSPDKEKSKYSI